MKGKENVYIFFFVCYYNKNDASFSLSKCNYIILLYTEAYKKCIDNV